jgi:hypothetical protein
MMVLLFFLVSLRLSHPVLRRLWRLTQSLYHHCHGDRREVFSSFSSSHSQSGGLTPFYRQSKCGGTLINARRALARASQTTRGRTSVTSTTFVIIKRATLHPLCGRCPLYSSHRTFSLLSSFLWSVLPSCSHQTLSTSKVYWWETFTECADIEQWIEEANIYFRLSNIDPSQWLLHATGLMSGQALK